MKPSPLAILPVCLLAWTQLAAAVSEIAFPADAGVADVTQAPYLAVPDGKTDCTVALQKALDEKRSLIYLPNGTYLVSDTLRWGAGEGKGSAWKRQILQGQSEHGVVIKLADGTPGFSDAAQPKPVVWTGKAPAQRFRNAIRNLTVDTGKGNAGAIGVQFIANNQGGMRDITLRSGDGSGPIGLDLGYTDEQGPCLIKGITVLGFDVGIRTKHAVDSVTLEDIRLEGQRSVGFLNDGQCISLRGFRSRNAVTAYKNAAGPSLTALLDAELIGTPGAETQPAILNAAGLFARNVTTSGYPLAVENRAGTKQNASGPQIVEFVSHETLTLFPGASHSLNLPVKETPQVPWEAPEKWVSVKKFGPPKTIELIPQKGGPRRQVADWSEPLQRAIDSGATTIYFPNQQGGSPGNVASEDRAATQSAPYGFYRPVRLRGKVQRIIGCEADFAKLVSNNEVPTDYQPELRPVFILEDGDAPAVIVERFSSWFLPIRFEQRSSRSLVISSLSFYDLETQPGSGDVFLDDVRSKTIQVRGSKLWGRQVNIEGQNEPRLLCDGGDVWILGLKTENDATVGLVRNKGRMEIVGGFNYGNKNYINPKTLFVNEGSSLSLTTGGSVTKNGRPFDILVRETRGDETRLLTHKQAPRRGPSTMIPLYVGREGSTPPAPEE